LDDRRRPGGLPYDFRAKVGTLSCLCEQWRKIGPLIRRERTLRRAIVLDFGGNFFAEHVLDTRTCRTAAAGRGAPFSLHLLAAS